MTKTEIKNSLEKFRQLGQSHPQLNQTLSGNVEATLHYCAENYSPSDLIEHERKVIVEAANFCFQMYVQVYNRSKFDSSIYALCSLGAAYGADRFMYDNGVSKFINPLQQLKNNGMTDNDLGEIDAYEKLCEKFGKPTDF